MEHLFPDSPERAMSVSELTGHLKAVVEGTFPPLWVSGEISDLARPRSGHLYFTLKDDHSQLRGVMWRSMAERLKFDLQDGQAVLCYGGLEVYAVRGSYQLVVRKMQPEGAGALQLALEQLRAKLDAEGLFAEERKRPLPLFPSRIGIITSTTGAALRDFLEAAKQRYRGTEILVIPAIVQGEQASRSIVSALQMAQRIRPALDLVILARGGGSLEDLWSFNEEVVLRSVAESSIPTVSAIGHEIDVTLCDMVADVRALTPTDAATRVLPDGQLLTDAFSGWQTRLAGAIRAQIRHHRAQLESLGQRPVLRSPTEFVHQQARILDDWDTRGRRAMENVIREAKHQVASASASLNALSPLSVLGRGYSVTYNAAGDTISSAGQLKSGDPIRTRLSQGEIHSVVKDSPDP